MATWNFSSTAAPSRLVGNGCLECPEGWGVAPDAGLGALETAAKRIFLLEDKKFDGPMFPLAEMPVVPARTDVLGSDDYAIDYDFHIPGLEEVMMHNPLPTRERVNRITEALNNCGPEGIASNVFDMASIGCNPPRGKSGVMGKDIASIVSHVVPLSMGPFCVTMFQNFEHLVRMFRKMSAEYPNAIKQVVNYQKIRDFIAGNYNLAAATAGSWKPRFSQFQFTDRPNSVGSIEWFFEAFDRISAFGGTDQQWTVSMSRRVFKRWMSDYAKRKGVTLNLDFNDLNGQVGSYIMRSNSQDSVELVTDRLNQRIRIDFTRTPIYVIDNQVGEAEYEFQFQPFYTTRAGDDNRAGEAAGWVRDKNVDYGSACASCPDGPQSLSELILIYNGESHQYEAMPKSPFAGAGLEGVETDLQALWGSLEMKIHTGVEVDTYYLQPLFHHLGLNCPNNRLNQWFAGEIWANVRTRFLRKRAAGALLVKVPNDAAMNVEEADCLVNEYPEPVSVTFREPQGGGLECLELSEDPAAAAGALRPDCDFTVVAPTSGTTTIEIEVERRDGTAGELTVDYEGEEGTATEPEHYAITPGTLTFADGQTRGTIEVAIQSQAAVNPEDAASIQFKVLWTGDLAEGACEETIVTIQTPTDSDVEPAS